MKCSEFMSELQSIINNMGDLDLCIASKYLGTYGDQDIERIEVKTIDINGLYTYAKIIGEFND